MLQVLVNISLENFQLQKRGMGYARVIHEKKKVLKKWTQKCPRYLKQWVLRCPPKKREKKMNKIALIL